MTVQSTTARADYTGNGVTTQFTVPFYFLDPTHVKVLRTDTSTTPATVATLVLNSDYVVTGAGVATGGTIQTTVAPTATQKLTVLRNVPQTQLIHYVPNDPFPAATHEQALDQLTMEVQQLNESVGHAITSPVYEQPGALALAPAAQRQGQLLGFDANGNLLLYPITASVGAGSMTYNTFASGTQFTPGVTTALTLSVAYGTAANIDVYFDGAHQGPDQFTLNGTTLNFTSPIPVGTQNVFVKGGTTLSTQIPPNNTITDLMLAVGSKMAARVKDFTSVRDFGVIPAMDGVADDTAAAQAAIAGIGTSSVTLIIAGPMKISSNLTFGANTEVLFTQGGKFIGTSGAEVITVQKQIIAGPRPIFSNCAPISTVGQQVFPEWFGAVRDGATTDKAAFNLAYGFLKNTGGVIQMLPGVYALDAAITNCQSHVALLGAGQNITQLKVTGINADAIDCNGTAGAFINNPVFQGFNIVSATPGSTGGTGISLQYTTLAKCTDIQVIDFLNGIYMQRATNTFHTRVGASYSGTANNFIGFNIFGGGTGAGGNASSTWRDCYVDGSASSGTGKVAYHAYGAYVSDLYFSNCSSASCNYGWSFDYSTATAGGYADVIIHNPVIDNYTLQGILVNAMPAQQMLTIIGGWINPAGAGSETDGVYITNCVGQVTVKGAQISGENNYANAVGVRVINSKSVKVSGCTFQDNNYHIKETGSSFCVYSANSFNNQSSHPATVQVYMQSSTRSMATGNAHDGYATNAVLCPNDSTSTGVGVTCSVFNASTLAAPRVSNNSAGPVGGSDGSLGVNSGV